MAKRENRGLSGCIEIKYDWEESSSGHIENLHSIELVVEDNKIVLKEIHGHTNYSKSSETRNSIKCIEIDASTLIELIKKHGREISDTTSDH